MPRCTVRHPALLRPSWAAWLPSQKIRQGRRPCLAASARLNTPKNDRCSPSPKREKSGKITPSKNTSKGEKNLKKKKKFLYVEKMIYICM